MTSTKVTERDVQIKLMRRALISKNHKVAIPNSTQLLRSEVDLLTVTKAGLTHEFEIKLNRSDYNREFTSHRKKQKHWWLQNTTYRSYAPNYFWLVTYDFDIEPPEYCGWIKLLDDGYLKRMKDAPRLHSRKWDDREVARVARLLSFRLLKVYEDGHV